MSLPTFFLVGAPKAGTTTLFDRVGQHPDAFVSARKEPHYFTDADEWPGWRVKTLDAYHALFAEAGDAAAIGEGSTWYLYSPTAASAIAALVPEAKILVALRNPVDRAFSAWGYNVEKGWETEPTFEDALAREDERVAAPGFWDRHYVRAGMYADQLQRYHDTFGRDRVEVVLFDDLRTDPDATLQRIYAFLGLSPFTPPNDSVRNRTRYPRSARLARLVRSGPVRRAARWFPGPVRSRIKSTVVAANTVERPSMAPETRRRLVETFRGDVNRLGAMIDRPLTRLWLET